MLNKAEVRYDGRAIIGNDSKKIKVRSYSLEGGGKGKPESKTVLGQPYFSDKNGEVPQQALNGTAQFQASKKQIVCRHLVLALPPKEPNTHFVDRVAQRLGTPALIRDNIPFSTDHVSDKIYTKSLDNYLVEGKQLGMFVRDQLIHMKEGSEAERHFQLNSYCHAMELTLKRKEEDGKTIFVATLYDPNRTLTHSRIVESDLDKIAINWSLKTFLPDDLITDYFGKTTPLISLIPLPVNLNGNEVLATDWPGGGQRSLKTYLPKDKWIADNGFFLMSSGLPLDEMRKALSDCRTSEERMAVLGCKIDGHGRGLSFACQYGNAQTVKDFIELVSQQRSAGFLSSEQVVDLLRAEGKGVYWALRQGDAETVRVFVEGVGQLIAGRHLTSSQAVGLLSDGQLWRALKPGLAKTVQVFIEGVSQLKKDGLLTSQQLVDLLRSNGPGGMPGLSLALQGGRTETVRVFIDGVRRLIADGHLTSSQAADLLSAKGKDGVPGLSLALQEGNAETVRVFIDGVKHLGIDQSLRPEQVVDLVCAKHKDGVTGLQMALKNGRTEAVKALLDGVRQLMLVGNSAPSFVADQLGVKTKDDVTMLQQIALQNRHTETAEAFIERVDRLKK